MPKDIYLPQEEPENDLIDRKRILPGRYGEYQDHQDVNNTVIGEERY